MAFVGKVVTGSVSVFGAAYDALQSTEIDAADVAAHQAAGWTLLSNADVTLIQQTADQRLLTIDAGAVRALTGIELTAAGIDLLLEYKLRRVEQIDARTVELLGAAGMPAASVALRAAEDVAVAGTIVSGGKTLVTSIMAAVNEAAVDAIQDNR